MKTCNCCGRHLKPHRHGKRRFCSIRCQHIVREMKAAEERRRLGVERWQGGAVKALNPRGGLISSVPCPLVRGMRVIRINKTWVEQKQRAIDVRTVSGHDS